MHTVTCPKCKNVLKVTKPVFDAKVRCAACKTVFVASSVPTAPSAPVVVQPQAVPAAQPRQRAGRQGSSARSDHDRLYRAAPGQKTSTPLVVGSIMGVVGVLVLVFLIGYLADRRSKTPPAEDAQTPTTKGVAKGNGRTAPPPTGGGRTTPPPTGGGRTTPPPKVRPKPKGPTNDDMIAVDLRTRTTGIATKVVYGQVVNNHDYPVASITLTFLYKDATGKWIPIGNTDPCEHVPPKGKARFSTRIGKLPPGMGLQVFARSEPEPEGVVCWMVDTDEVRTDVEDGNRTLVMRGKVANPLNEDVVDVRLLCDFIDRNGQVYPAVGKLTKAFRLKPGVEESYTVERRNLIVASGMMSQPLLRLVGRVE